MQLDILDISNHVNPGVPFITGRFNPGTIPGDMMIKDGYLYLAYSNAGPDLLPEKATCFAGGC